MAVFDNFNAYNTMQIGGGNYVNTSTTTGLMPQHVSAWWSVPSVPPPKPLLARQRDRIALRAAGRSTPFPPLSSPSTGLTGAYTAAPRRTVVPRGRVSWVRAGTRRPL